MKSTGGRARARAPPRHKCPAKGPTCHRRPAGCRFLKSWLAHRRPCSGRPAGACLVRRKRRARWMWAGRKGHFGKAAHRRALVFGVVCCFTLNKVAITRWQLCVHANICHLPSAICHQHSNGTPEVTVGRRASRQIGARLGVGRFGEQRAPSPAPPPTRQKLARGPDNQRAGPHPIERQPGALPWGGVKVSNWRPLARPGQRRPPGRC